MNLVINNFARWTAGAAPRRAFPSAGLGAAAHAGRLLPPLRPSRRIATAVARWPGHATGLGLAALLTFGAIEGGALLLTVLLATIRALG